MKIQSSQLQFMSSHQTKTSTQVIQGNRQRSPAGAITATGTDIRRSLESTAQTTQQRETHTTTADGKTSTLASASQQQQGARYFVEGQSRSQGTTGASPTGNTSSQYFLHEEAESTHYQLQGTLALDDGRQLDFNITANLSRQLRIEEGSGLYTQQIERKDPLIVNVGADNAQLTQRAFAFDLDADGHKENISFATGGSGFLFLDQDGDGTLSNGKELFGTQSGDGFGDLSAYDDDGNGFIDSGDNVFGKLMLLSRNEAGDDSVNTLASLGIGALSTGAARTRFELTNDLQQSYGRLQATGIGVTETGDVITVQQVDLTQRDEHAEAAFRQHFEQPQELDAPSGQLPDLAPPQALREALAQLDAMSKAMLDGMNPLEDDAEKAPKTLLGLLVDGLEAYTRQQSQSAVTKC